MAASDQRDEVIIKLKARIRELEAENAQLKKVIEIDECGRPALEARDKKITTLLAIAEKRDAELLRLAVLLDQSLRKGQELNTENAALKNRLDKYDIPDAEVDKILAAMPDLKIKAAEHPDPEVRDALLKLDLAIEAFAANLKITRQENAALKEYKVRDGKVIGNNLTRIAELKDNNAQLREALGAADKEIEKGKTILKKAMLSGDIPTTPNTYALVNADLFLRDARALIEAALKGV